MVIVEVYLSNEQMHFRLNYSVPQHLFKFDLDEEESEEEEEDLADTEEDEEFEDTEEEEDTMPAKRRKLDLSAHQLPSSTSPLA